MPYRFKQTEPFCEFKLRDRGPADHPALTVEVEFTLFKDGAEYPKGVEFKSRLKALPKGAWFYDGDGRWFILPQFLQFMQKAALTLYRHVYQTEGATTTDLTTGAEQKGLFG